MQGAKQCPSCFQINPLHEPECTKCGHQFRTQFGAGIPDQTIAIDLAGHRIPGAPIPPPVLYPPRQGFNTPTDWSKIALGISMGAALLWCMPVLAIPLGAIALAFGVLSLSGRRSATAWGAVAISSAVLIGSLVSVIGKQASDRQTVARQAAFPLAVTYDSLPNGVFVAIVRNKTSATLRGVSASGMWTQSETEQGSWSDGNEVDGFYEDLEPGQKRGLIFAKHPGHSPVIIGFKDSTGDLGVAPDP